MRLTTFKKNIIISTIVLSGFFSGVTLAEQSTQPNTKITINQQDYFSFINQTMSNWASKLNMLSIESKIELSQIEQASDGNINATLRTSLYNEDGSGPFTVDLNYVISPLNSSINNEQVVAKFNLLSTNIIDTTDEPELDGLVNFTLTAIEQMYFVEKGYLTESGDIVNAQIKSTKALTYNNDDNYNELAVTVPSASVNYRTHNSMTTIDSVTTIPRLAGSSDDITFNIQDIKWVQTDVSLEAIDISNGQSNFSIDSIILLNEKAAITIKDFIANSVYRQNKENLLDEQFTLSFNGNYKEDKFTSTNNFSVNGALNSYNLDMPAIERLAQTLNNDLDQSEQEQFVIDFFNNLMASGSKFDFKDIKVMVNNHVGIFNILMSFTKNQKISNDQSLETVMLQTLNNLDMKVDISIPSQWFIESELFTTKRDFDRMINEGIEQLNAIGFDGVVSYDKKNVKLKFELKKSSVFVNGELKGSLLTLLPAFLM